MRITFDCTPQIFPRLTSDIEISIFRVLQEAVTNAHRHSGSKDVRVDLHQLPDRVNIRVRDYGVGVPSDWSATGSVQLQGVGINGMRERLRQMGGQLTIVPAQPGTLVEAVIPLFG